MEFLLSYFKSWKMMLWKCCRGIGWRGRWERELGWGIHINPWLIHVNVWQKPLQYCKVISLQLIKTNGKKKWILNEHKGKKKERNKVLHSISQQIWKIQQWPQGWKISVFIPIPKKGNAKECSDYNTVALISHARKVMLRILQIGFNSMWTKNFQMFWI